MNLLKEILYFIRIIIIIIVSSLPDLISSNNKSIILSVISSAFESFSSISYFVFYSSSLLNSCSYDSIDYTKRTFK